MGTMYDNHYHEIEDEGENVHSIPMVPTGIRTRDPAVEALTSSHTSNQLFWSCFSSILTLW